ncbi:MAG: DUF6390 family protein [Thermoplasmata archaeon]|jgi:hypothetical protein|nr:DUF6390 family protein [Thermoplasmata archaeon]
MNGVQLGARFSLATNRLQYCGPADAEPLLYRAITSDSGHAEAARALSGFEALMPYLEMIAEKHGRKPFDAEVVEAYWVGNPLLDAFEREDFARLLSALVRRGLPRSMAERLAGRLPSRPLPHHLFHVAFVGVGNVTGHVPTTLVNMEACRPAWAEVVDATDEHLLVRGPTLVRDQERVAWGPVVDRELSYDPQVIDHPRAGDSVAIHWGWPALRLSPTQRAALERYSRLALDQANEAFVPATGPVGSRTAPARTRT